MYIKAMTSPASKNLAFGCALLLGGFVLAGCRSVPDHSTSTKPAVVSTNSAGATTNSVSEPRQWYSVVVKPAPNLRPIHFYERINPVWWLQNRDEPHPPDWFAPNSKHREFKWWVRNPIHNFSFYVVGITDRTFVRSGRFPEKVLVPGHWNIAVSRYKFIYLPYVSFSSKHGFNFYFGWRHHGNFGIKLNHETPRPPKPKPEQAPEQKPAKPSP